MQGAERLPGDRWMIRGPLEYVPPVEVEVATKRKAIPLDENEGIYVRDIKTGKVRKIFSRMCVKKCPSGPQLELVGANLTLIISAHCGSVSLYII